MKKTPLVVGSSVLVLLVLSMLWLWQPRTVAQSCEQGGRVLEPEYVTEKNLRVVFDGDDGVSGNSTYEYTGTYVCNEDIKTKEGQYDRVIIHEVVDPTTPENMCNDLNDCQQHCQGINTGNAPCGGHGGCCVNISQQAYIQGGKCHCTCNDQTHTSAGCANW